jgi:hypothetical protein
MSRSVAAWRAYFRKSVDAIIVRMTLQSTVATQQRKNTATRKTHSNVRSFSTELGCQSDARLPSNSDQTADIVSCFVQPLGRRQTNNGAHNVVEYGVLRLLQKPKLLSRGLLTSARPRFSFLMRLLARHAAHCPRSRACISSRARKSRAMSSTDVSSARSSSAASFATGARRCAAIRCSISSDVVASRSASKLICRSR